jgi:CubicO group peptidase (beta-lactamase class C family)
MSGRTRRFASIGALAALAAGLACSDQLSSTSGNDEVDQLFAEWNQPNAPGCSVGISRNGRTIHEQGYGTANLERAVPISPASVLSAASISKSFTAMSILLLADRGQLSLDDDVAKYVAGWGEHGARISIRHLLSHTSGLRDAFLLQGLRPEHPENINQQIVSVLAHTRALNFAPGSQFEYNNGGFTLLAAIVERVSGQKFSSFVEANIFEPLGMTHSYVHDETSQVIPNRALGYSRSENGFRLVVRTYTDVGQVVGNAGLFTTVGDLLRWEQNFTDARVGDAALLRDMETPVISTDWSGTSRYGFGVEIAQHGGLRTVGHGGGDDGVRSYVVRYPERGLAIAILCNRDDMNPVPVARSIAEILLDGMFPEPATNAASAAPAPRSVPLPLQDLQSTVGLYRNLSDDSVGRIFIRDGKLIASGGGNEFELTPIATNRFAIMGTAVVAEFVPPIAGKPQEFHVTGAGPQPFVTQLITPFAPSVAALLAFAGTYTSEEVDGTYAIAARDSGLVLRVPTRTDIELQPVFTDAFDSRMLGVVKFSRDARGRVTAFTATAPGVRGLRFNRVPVRPASPGGSPASSW